MSSPLRVAVLLGGSSAQREISLASGIAVAAALEAAGHFARDIDPSEVDLVDVDWRRFDGCFLALLGGEGESGGVQQLLRELNVPFTGSGETAAQRAYSKSAAKERFALGAVPTPRFTLMHSNEPIGRMVKRAETLDYPLIIKPDAQGSSLGVGLAHDRDELERCIAHAQFYDRFLIAEPYIAGREFTLTILGRQPLPLAELQLGEPVLTHQAKLYGKLQCSFDLDLPPEQAKQLVRSGLAAAEAIETSGLVRVDLRLDADGQPWVLELNTTPDLSPGSLVAQALARVGIGMPALCERLMRDCLPLETRR